MSHRRNGFSSPANQLNRTDSSTRLPTHAHDSGLQPPPVFSPPNLLLGSDSIVHRSLPFRRMHTQMGRTVQIDTPHQHIVHNKIPIHDSGSSSSLPLRQPNQILQQASRVHPHPTTPERTTRQATQDSEDWVLEKLKKVTYNPTHKNPVKSPSFHHTEQNHGGTVHTNMQYSEDEGRKGCAVCLEDFEPEETVMLTPCNHIFHEECIIRWVKSRGQCPVCRCVICEPRDVDPGQSGFMAANDLLALELLSVVRALEESSIFGYLRRRF